MAKIAPSFLSADIWRAAEQISSLEQVGCEYLHLDVMDGCFVPNISFGAPIIKGLRTHTQMMFDVHLMVEEPERFLEDFAAAGADIITVHLEACRHLHRVVQKIKSLGVKAGVSLNPATPISLLKDILPDLDLVLLMSVNPGFSGQSFIESTLPKLRKLSKLRDKRGLGFVIEVDGGVCPENALKLAEAGAGILVAGASVFGQPIPAEAFSALRAQIDE